MTARSFTPYKRETTSPKTCWGIDLHRKKDQVFAKKHCFRLQEPLTVYRGSDYLHDVERPFLERSRADATSHHGTKNAHDSLKALLERESLEKICRLAIGGVLRGTAYTYQDPFVHTTLHPEVPFTFSNNDNGKIYEIKLEPGQELIDISNHLTGNDENLVLIPGHIKSEQVKGIILTKNFKTFLAEIDKRIKITPESQVTRVYKISKEYKDLLSLAIKDLKEFTETSINEFLDQQKEVLNIINKKIANVEEKFEKLKNDSLTYIQEHCLLIQLWLEP